MNAVAIIGVVSAFSLVFLWLLMLCSEKGVHPFRRVRQGCRRLPVWEKTLLSIFVGVWIAFASVKDGTNQMENVELKMENGVRGGSILHSPFYTLHSDDIAQLWRIDATVDGNAFAVATENAVTNMDWRDYGGMSDSLRIKPDGWWFPYGDKTTTGLTVFENGDFRPNVKTHFFPPPFDANLSLLPKWNWGLLPGGGESVFWHEHTPSNSLVLTWHNALYNRDVNSPTNFQAELFADGRFDYRYPDRTVQYVPVFPFDWDGDGLANEVDPEPLVAGPNAHGTNAEWYNRVCGNVFAATQGADGLELAPRTGDVNTNAYFFIDVIAESVAPVHFFADGPSNLGSPVVVAQAGETNHVPLLIGANYCISSSVPLTVFAPQNVALERRWDVAGASVFDLVWPAGLGYERIGDLYQPSVDESSRLAGEFSWTGGCCLRMQGDALSFGCNGCGCSGCSAMLNYTYEGYTCTVLGPHCGCTEPPDNPATPFVTTFDGAAVAAGFDRKFVVISDEVTNGVARSTRTVLTLAAWGGANGGTLTVDPVNFGRLRAVDGGTLPSPGSRTLLPHEVYSIVVTNEGVVASEAIDDVQLCATFEENNTGTRIRRNTRLTVCEFSVDAIRFNHDFNAYTNDAINIRVDGGTTNGVYDITNGEWCDHGNKNCPACYVGGTKPVVKVRFKAKPHDLSSAKFLATASAAGFVLGDLQINQVAFANGVSQWVDCHPVDTNAIPVMVKKHVSRWQWNLHCIENENLDAFSIGNSGDHVVYTVLAHPTLPWRVAKDDPQCAWVYALERACVWADGATTTNAMMAAVTSNLFFNMGFRYDTKEGEATYWDVFKKSFDLAGYLVPTNSQVNCYDQAYGCVTLCNLLGGNAYPVKTRPFGFINPIRLVGVSGLCNNPFFEGTNRCTRVMAVVRNGELVYEPETYFVPRTPLCEFYDYIGRSLFGNHMFVLSESDMIFDACAGPTLGTMTFVEYLNSVIDHSTPVEANYSCFRQGINPYGIGYPNELKTRNFPLKQTE